MFSPTSLGSQEITNLFIVKNFRH